MKRGLRAVFVFAILLSGAAQAADLPTARYTDPTTRYGHFALGPPHEYAAIEITTKAGVLRFDLPAHEVFEDLAPRPVRLQKDGPQYWLSIISDRSQGAALALLGIESGRLKIVARAAPIGQSQRWLNPVAVVDLDGDGVAEISAVITPHIAGKLKVYRRNGDQLIELAALGGFSNHVYGSAELGLSTATVFRGQTVLAVPDQSRNTLRLIRYANNQLQELARCPLGAPLQAALRKDSVGQISVQQQNQSLPIDFAHCAATNTP